MVADLLDHADQFLDIGGGQTGGWLIQQ